MMFPHMIPYAEPFYFFLLAIALIPIVLSLLIWKKRLPIYQSVVTLFFLFVSYLLGAGSGADRVCFLADNPCMGLFCSPAKEKSNRMVLRRRYFSNNSTVFNESDSFF